MIELTKEENQILLHSLGLNYKPFPFRNHFVTGENSGDYPTIQSLIKKECMIENSGPKFLNNCDKVFSVTKLGEKMAEQAFIAARPKLTRGQRRYRKFLELDFDGFTFGEFLKSEMCPK